MSTGKSMGGGRLRITAASGGTVSLIVLFCMLFHVF